MNEQPKRTSYIPLRRTKVSPRIEALFWNTWALCGVVIAISITVKLIISIFT